MRMKMTLPPSFLIERQMRSEAPFRSPPPRPRLLHNLVTIYISIVAGYAVSYSGPRFTGWISQK